MIARLSQWLDIMRRFWWMIPVVAIPLSAWTHIKAGYTFPSPWPDEAVFIWPAKAFSETGSLQSDSMNPDRAIWWHPPGYQWFLGLLFRVVEPGLDSARWISWTLITMAYLGLIALFKRERSYRFEVIAVLSVFYLNAHAVIAGNVARPEALIIAINVWACWFMMNGKPWATLSLSGLSLICHPTGAFYLAGFGFLFISQYRLRWPKPLRVEWFIMTIALGVLVYAMTILLPQWDVVLRDLTVSVAHNKESLATRVERMLQPRVLLPLIMMIIISIGEVLIRRKNYALVVLGWIAWSIIHVRPEMWYTAHHAISYAVFSTLLIVQLCELISCWCAEVLRRWAGMAALGMMVAGLFVLGHAPDPRHYPLYLWWYHMTVRDGKSYHQPVDVQRAIESLSKIERSDDATLRVMFIPGGEGALYTGQLPDGMTPFYPVLTSTRPDIYIVRVSNMTYPGFRKDALEWINKLSIDDQEPYHTRYGEAWFMALHGTAKE